MHVVVLEQVTRRGDLGLRFTDLVRRAAVNDGLVVEAWAQGASSTRFAAYRSPVSGIYGFRSLPGLKDYEDGKRPASDFCHGASPPNFVVVVEDSLGRYLPQALQLCLPKEAVVEVQLFSSPARTTPSGQGAIRGEVWDWTAGGPAAWALVKATIDGGDELVTEADDRGMFALFVPYAAALPALVGTPPVGTGNVGEVTWDVMLTVQYQPSMRKQVEGVEVPDTLSILGQGAAAIYGAFAEDVGPSAPASTLALKLQFGVELVAHTPGSPRLLVEAAA